MKSVIRLAVAIAAISALAAIPGTAHASPTHLIFGDTNGDRHGQHAYWDTAHCGLIANDPAVVTINGTRYLQTAGKIACEGASIEQLRIEVVSYSANGSGTSTPSSSTAVVGMKSAGAVSDDQASLVLRLPCRNWGLTSYATYFTVEVESDRSGQTATVFDFSRFNGRSCSV